MSDSEELAVYKKFASDTHAEFLWSMEVLMKSLLAHKCDEAMNEEIRDVLAVLQQICWWKQHIDDSPP